MKEERNMSTLRLTMEECTHSHQASWASTLALLRGDAVGQYISDLNITAAVAYSGRIGWSSESGVSSHRETLWATAVFKGLDINAAVAYSWRFGAGWEQGARPCPCPCPCPCPWPASTPLPALHSPIALPRRQGYLWWK